MVALPTLHGAFRHAGDHDVLVHQHPYDEIILVRKGRLRTALDGADHVGTPGACHLVPAGHAHDQRSRGTWATTCLLVAGLGSYMPHRGETLDRVDARILRWADDLCDLHRRGAPAETTGGLVLTLIAALAEARPRSTETTPEPVRRACAFMDEHLAQAISDEAVADAAAVSVSHLGALFRATFGCGPLRWLQDRRLDLAARLLADPYTSVQAIAGRCGYHDPTHFIRHFKRRHGRTPGAWRKA